ncbi:MAG: DNA mismatch repair endonuclease MutL [Peptococcaceae bacterium]|nr:DNA mismatch repair endonuclease MutL [Peptococcaceae bacterium]
MAKIIVLDKHTADKIAAGEVVERPASVVKELIENSIDAGAHRIVIELEDGGLSKISVSDDGSGIESAELELAFQRHATSKITSTVDLNYIHTLGFRGEALPSIAAVSKLTVITRTEKELTGTQAELEGGKLVAITPTGAPIGTTIEVKDIFYNTPARRKTLKSPSTEGSLCGELVSRLALARPDIRFELRIRNKNVFYSPGSGILADAVTAVYGINMVREMLPLDFAEEGLTLTGMVGKPSISRSSRNHITIIINGRYVRCAPITTTVEAAYQTLLPHGRKPVVAISLDIPPELLDINVHPAKQEIRLLEEARVTEIVQQAIFNTLRTKEIIPSASSATHRKYQSGLILPQNGQEAQQERLTGLLQPPTGNETKSAAPVQPAYPATKTGAQVQEELTHPLAMEMPDDYNSQETAFPELQPLAQLASLYILAAGDDGLYIIDQHAAHERIRYENFLAGQRTTESQCLLKPVLLELDYRDATVLTDKILWFTEAGFIVEHFGGNTFLLRGVPAGFPQGQEKTLFLDLLDYFQEKGVASNQDEFIERLAATVACKHAVKSGEKLTISSMTALIEELAATANPYTCPHGRPTITKISYRDLATRFKR